MAVDRGFYTPPPSFSSRTSYAPKSCKSENSKNYYCSSPSTTSDRFHIIHKVPAGDSPYVRAKRVQLIDKDPTRSISLFWKAINTGDRVDSAVKDMAVVMKQLDRSDEAIEAIRSFRHLCSAEAQESLDNILIELYKRSGRMEEQVEILMEKVKRIEEESSIGGRRTKMARSQGKKIHITVEQEYSRLLGNLAWVHLQQNNYKEAEEYYRKALSIELDRNKQCNLAICLMLMNRIMESRLLLQSIKASASNQPMDESYVKSYERAYELLDQIESEGGLHAYMKGKENRSEQECDFDCQSQLDYLDNMCAVGASAKKSQNTLHTPVVSKGQSGAETYTSAQRLFTQPIDRRTMRRYPKSPCTQPKRYPVIQGHDEAKEALVFGNFSALSNDEAEVTVEKQNANSEKSDPCNVEQTKEVPLPHWLPKSGKRWADMAEEDEEEVVSSGSSKSSSARRSLTFDNEEKQDTDEFESLPLKPKALLNLKGSNGDISDKTTWSHYRNSKGTRKSHRLPVFCGITPASVNAGA